jgi:hypothetical protein
VRLYKGKPLLRGISPEYIDRLRRKEADFLKTTQVVLAETFGNDDMRTISKIARQAWELNKRATGPRLNDIAQEAAAQYRDRLRKVANKYDRFMEAFQDMQCGWFDSEFLKALEDAGVSFDTANRVCEAIDQTVHSKSINSVIRKNQRPKHDDYHFNIPLAKILMDLGLNRKAAARTIAKIRVRANVLVSPGENVEKLTSRIEQQVRNTEN